MKPDKMTGELVATLLEQFPDNLTTDQLSAFILTLVDTYGSDKPTKAFSLLVTTAIIYAKHNGSTDEKIAQVLTSTANHLVEDKSKKVH